MGVSITMGIQSVFIITFNQKNKDNGVICLERQKIQTTNSYYVYIYIIECVCRNVYTPIYI